MEIFGIDIKEIATPYGIITLLCVIIGMIVFFGFDFLKKQSELARINQNQLEQITKLSNDLGKTREGYDRAVKDLDSSQGYVIFLQELISQKTSNNRSKQQD
jgi:hypothetical protein